ncbi:hypothetical protein H5410_015332 [Solanum commersonii]|uniref:Uncharacterized protein n=1 Tax=Solanum commersonii TaxID=4109 RepID=A0A9J5ZU36_SOLCO|nr:hypothetical protein H5410_015332 [Solanum commersonii]
MIPRRVKELQNLQYIDLSNNSYLQLDKLKILEFVFKSSSGVISSGGVFANSTLQSFLQNKGIYKMHILDMPSCAIATSGQQSKLKEVVPKNSYFILSDIFVGFNLDNEMTEERKVQRCGKDKKKKSKFLTKMMDTLRKLCGTEDDMDEDEDDRALKNPSSSSSD